MRKSNALPALIFVVIVLLGIALAASLYRASPGWGVAIVVIAVLVAWAAAYSVKVANQWERVVVLRLGRFRALEGPGLFFIIPILESVAY